MIIKTKNDEVLLHVKKWEYHHIGLFTLPRGVRVYTNKDIVNERTFHDGIILESNYTHEKFSYVSSNRVNGRYEIDFKPMD